jgi:hypothetical protein
VRTSPKAGKTTLSYVHKDGLMAVKNSNSTHIFGEKCLFDTKRASCSLTSTVQPSGSTVQPFNRHHH